MTAPTYISGQGGSIQVATTTYPVESWSIKLSNELEDVTTTASNGWAQWLATINQGEITISLFFDGTTPQVGAFAPGAYLASVTLHVGTMPGGSGAALSYSMAMIVQDATLENPAKNAVKLTITGKAQGAVTFA